MTLPDFFPLHGTDKGTQLIPSGYFLLQATFHVTHFSVEGLVATGTRWNAERSERGGSAQPMAGQCVVGNAAFASFAP